FDSRGGVRGIGGVIVLVLIDHAVVHFQRLLVIVHAVVQDNRHLKSHRVGSVRIHFQRPLVVAHRKRVVGIIFAQVLLVALADPVGGVIALVRARIFVDQFFQEHDGAGGFFLVGLERARQRNLAEGLNQILSLLIKPVRFGDALLRP